jgi:hypothetical protein
VRVQLPRSALRLADDKTGTWSLPAAWHLDQAVAAFERLGLAPGLRKQLLASAPHSTP